MSLYRIMLLTLVVLLCCGVEATQNKIAAPPNIPVRLRRLTNTIDSAVPEVKELEERGIFSNLKTNLVDWIKTTYWTTFGKSDDYVKKKLGLQTLTGTALTNHPNYRLLAKFRYKVEGRMLDNWYNHGVKLHGAWTRLGLDRISQSTVMQTDAYKTYVRYVRRYDGQIYWHKNSIFEPPIEYGGSHAELMAKVKVWAAADRPKWYVREMLQLEKSTMKTDPDYKYYLKFLELRGK